MFTNLWSFASVNLKFSTFVPVILIYWVLEQNMHFHISMLPHLRFCASQCSLKQINCNLQGLTIYGSYKSFYRLYYKQVYYEWCAVDAPVDLSTQALVCPGNGDNGGERVHEYGDVQSFPLLLFYDAFSLGVVLKTLVPATEPLAPLHELVLVPDDDVSGDEAMKQQQDTMVVAAVLELVMLELGEVVLLGEFHVMVLLDSYYDLLLLLLLSPSNDYDVIFCVVHFLDWHCTASCCKINVYVICINIDKF